MLSPQEHFFRSQQIAQGRQTEIEAALERPLRKSSSLAFRVWKHCAIATLQIRHMLLRTLRWRHHHRSPHTARQPEGASTSTRV